MMVTNSIKAKSINSVEFISLTNNRNANATTKYVSNPITKASPINNNSNNNASNGNSTGTGTGAGGGGGGGSTGGVALGSNQQKDLSRYKVDKYLLARRRNRVEEDTLNSKLNKLDWDSKSSFFKYDNEIYKLRKELLESSSNFSLKSIKSNTSSCSTTTKSNVTKLPSLREIKISSYPSNTFLLSIGTKLPKRTQTLPKSTKTVAYPVLQKNTKVTK